MKGTSTFGIVCITAMTLTAAAASAQMASEDLTPNTGYGATHAYKGRVIGTQSPPDQVSVGSEYHETHALRGRVIGGTNETLAPLAAPLPGYQVTHSLKGKKIGTEDDVGMR